jgi:hypothetical protein
MNRQRRSRSIYRNLLVFALAAQVITPDYHDLVSNSVFSLLLFFNSVGVAGEAVPTEFPLSNPESSPAGGDSSTPDPVDQDDVGDEVGLPWGRQAGVALQRRGGGSSRPAFLPDASRRQRNDPHVRRVSPLHISDLRSEDRLIPFGRLIC